jgi:protein-S-isoprenylcysteine O-methyltransferase Ste14
VIPESLAADAERRHDANPRDHDRRLGHGVTIIPAVRESGPRLTPGARLFAWTGAALFVASLGCFLVFYGIYYGIPHAWPPRTGDIAWNVALFTVFALHHSVFARERIRAAVVRTVSAALERSFYVWVASLLLIAVCVAWRPVGGTAWTIERPLAWLLMAVQLTGIWLTVRSAAIIDVLDLAGLEPRRRSGPAEFKTDGPYGRVRHPIYTGWFLVVFPVAVMTNTRLVFAVVSGLYLLIAIPLEERSLRATTAGAYDEYIRRVRWKLVPGLY